jgi:hypothetical protein
MKKIITLTILLFTIVQSYGQIKNDSIYVGISGRVDTTDLEVKKVYHLFKNYIESRPDSIYDNPYWNKKEKVLDTLGNPAIFYKPFYNLQMSPNDIFTYWKPFIMTIIKNNETKYLLRIALINDSNDPSKVITILNLNAIKENEKWVLQNVIQDVENFWNSARYKYIKYIYPKNHIFSDSLARKSVDFCDSIAYLMNISNFDTINFFICDNPDEMGLLFGYEFYYLNYTTGLTNKWLNQIFSSKGNEYYPHEFVHMLLGKKNENRNYIIEEGLACFLGERNTIKYKKQISCLSNDYLQNKATYTLTSLLSNKAINNGYQTAYPVGSIIAEIVFIKKGYTGLKKLSDADTKTPEDIYNVIKTITGLNKIKFENEFRKMLLLQKEN